jgi:hypothetical protein
MTAPVPARGVRWRPAALAWLCLGASIVAVGVWMAGYPEPLALGGDNQTLHHPMFGEVLRQTVEGVLPIWTTGRWGGSPLVGDPSVV